jgi:hypothetical protein
MPNTAALDLTTLEALADTTRGRLTKTEAEQLAGVIRTEELRLYLLVRIAHDRAAHRAMGYSSFAEWVRAELGRSESWAFEQLDTGRVMVQIIKGAEEAGVNVSEHAIEPPPARVVRIAKRYPQQVRAAARNAFRDGADPLDAVRQVANLHKPDPRSAGAKARVVDLSSAPATRPCPACYGSGRVLVE